MLKSCFLVVLLAISAPVGFSAEAKSDEKPPDSDKEKTKTGEPKERTVSTKHSVTVNGQRIDYTATAGTILLRDRDDKPSAAIFYIAFTKDNVPDLFARPVTFSFNGGPGSSSVWLNLGLLGPRRVLFEEDGSPLPPPYKMADNEYSLLDETDIVFIDPVSTGFSRAVKAEDAKKFHSVQGDLQSVGDFIRLYTTRNERWASPKFIIGESYGTTRAAALSGELREKHRMNVNGIMLVSTVLNFETISFARGNDLPFILYLPSYTATAWYHKKLPSDLQGLPIADLVKKAEIFASGEYSTALLRGASLPPDKRQEIVKELARFTGLSPDYIDRADLRVPLSRFAQELLRAENRVVGRFDGRYKGFVRDHLSESMDYDPSGEAVYGAFTGAFNQYIRSELKFDSDLPYEILTGNVQPWNWEQDNHFLNVADILADSITRNPFLKVHVSSGYFDLATPWLATQYTFRHLGIDATLSANVTMDDYTAGHMMYLNLADLKKQKTDLAKFIKSASVKKP